MNNIDTMEESKSVLAEEEAKDILDRTIGFVNNCDSKASIMLGITGVIFTIIFTSEGLTEISNLIKIIVEFKSFCDVLFFLLGLVSVIMLFYGIGLLIAALIAKIDCNDYEQEGLDLASSIYFGNIADCKTFQDYRNRFSNANQESYLNDLLSQIYLNSCICKKKFQRYNQGLIYFIYGLSLFLLTIIAGIIIY